MRLYAVDVPDEQGQMQTFQADLLLLQTDPFVFALMDAMLSQTTTSDHVTYNVQTGSVQIPIVEITDVQGRTQRYRLEMQNVPDAKLILFAISNLEAL